MENRRGRNGSSCRPGNIGSAINQVRASILIKADNNEGRKWNKNHARSVLLPDNAKHYHIADTRGTLLRYSRPISVYAFSNAHVEKRKRE
jgi:hypothetical protein